MAVDASQVAQLDTESGVLLDTMAAWVIQADTVSIDGRLRPISYSSSSPSSRV